MKKLREKCKNKKGFTMVELIVVIVIILVLAAVLVPSLLKYIDKANQANCKSDAATALVQLQADVAEFYSNSANAGKKFNQTNIAGKTASNSYVAAPAADNCTYTVDDATGTITQFSYGNADYTITWAPGAGWTGPSPRARS